MSDLRLFMYRFFFVDKCHSFGKKKCLAYCGLGSDIYLVSFEKAIVEIIFGEISHVNISARF